MNAFFQRFYQQPAETLAALEAREHTAQVVKPGERARRERRFRWDDGGSPASASPLGQSIEQVIDTELDDLPLRTDPAHQIQLGTAARHDLREQVRQILASDDRLRDAAG